MNFNFLIVTGGLISCRVAFVIGILLFIGGFVYLFTKKGLKEEHFAAAAVFEFASSWVLYIPQELFNDIPDSVPGLKVLESVFTALLKTFNIYLGNGYERMGFEGYPVFSSIYDIVMVLANIALLLFVVGFIAKFLNGPYQRVKLYRRKNRYTYVFSVTNEKTLAIAESLFKAGDTGKGKINIVFANSDKKLEGEQKQKIDSFSGIYVDLSILDIIKKLKSRTKGIEVFLFGDKEQDNLNELEKIGKKLDDYRKESIRIFIELSETPWSLYDDFLKKNTDSQKNETGKEDGITINFVRSEENFAYNNLLKNSIFENAFMDGGIKQIKILLVGMNERNLEMLKAVLFLGQMPGYRLTVMVIDDGNRKKMINQKLPEIADKCDIIGNAVYELKYKEKIDIDSLDFESAIGNEYADFSYAFINIGDDLKNVNLAMRLRALCYRMNRKDGHKIQISIKNQEITKDWGPDSLDDLNFVGSVKDTYNYDFITMSDIEKGTIEIHKVRYPNNNPSWISYCNNEYNRHSVYARTLSFKHKVWVIDNFYESKYDLTSGETWRIYEHMRWNVYTRTLGYVLAPKELLDNKGNLDKKIRGIAKVHNDLIDYEELPEEEKKKDSLKLTKEIVNILKSI